MEKCPKNIKHEYVYSTGKGEVCKHCTAPRPFESVTGTKTVREKGAIVSPFLQVVQSEQPTQSNPVPIDLTKLNKDQLALLQKRLESIPLKTYLKPMRRIEVKHADITEQQASELLVTIKAKAGIFITFDEEGATAFKIMTANVGNPMRTLQNVIKGLQLNK